MPLGLVQLFFGVLAQSSFTGRAGGRGYGRYLSHVQKENWRKRSEVLSAYSATQSEI